MKYMPQVHWQRVNLPSCLSSVLWYSTPVGVISNKTYPLVCQVFCGTRPLWGWSQTKPTLLSVKCSMVLDPCGGDLKQNLPSCLSSVLWYSTPVGVISNKTYPLVCQVFYGTRPLWGWSQTKPTLLSVKCSMVLDPCGGDLKQNLPSCLSSVLWYSTPVGVISNKTYPLVCQVFCGTRPLWGWSQTKRHIHLLSPSVKHCNKTMSYFLWQQFTAIQHQ